MTDDFHEFLFAQHVGLNSPDFIFAFWGSVSWAPLILFNFSGAQGHLGAPHTDDHDFAEYGGLGPLRFAQPQNCKASLALHASKLQSLKAAKPLWRLTLQSLKASKPERFDALALWRGAKDFRVKGF